MLGLTKRASGFLNFGGTDSGGGGSPSLPIASSTALGGVKVGNNLTITDDGVLNAMGGGLEFLLDESIIGSFLGQTLFARVYEFNITSANYRYDVAMDDDVTIIDIGGYMSYRRSGTSNGVSIANQYGTGSDYLLTARTESKSSFFVLAANYIRQYADVTRVVVVYIRDNES